MPKVLTFWRGGTIKNVDSVEVQDVLRGKQNIWVIYWG